MHADKRKKKGTLSGMQGHASTKARSGKEWMCGPLVCPFAFEGKRKVGIQMTPVRF